VKCIGYEEPEEQSLDVELKWCFLEVKDQSPSLHLSEILLNFSQYHKDFLPLPLNSQVQYLQHILLLVQVTSTILEEL
jgi:hypothetical protein